MDGSIRTCKFSSREAPRAVAAEKRSGSSSTISGSATAACSVASGREGEEALTASRPACEGREEDRWMSEGREQGWEKNEGWEEAQGQIARSASIAHGRAHTHLHTDTHTCTHTHLDCRHLLQHLLEDQSGPSVHRLDALGQGRDVSRCGLLAGGGEQLLQQAA